MSKSLEVKILKTRDLGPRRRGRMGSDWFVHDYAIVELKARVDVTRGLWKILDFRQLRRIRGVLMLLPQMGKPTRFIDGSQALKRGCFFSA